MARKNSMQLLQIIEFSSISEIFRPQPNTDIYSKMLSKAEIHEQEVQIMNANAKFLYSNNRPGPRTLRRRMPPAVLNNKLEALKILANSILSEVSSLEPSPEVPSDTDVDLAEEVRRFEEDLIRNALTRTGGRQRKAAMLLGLNPTTLHAKMKRFGMIDDGNADDDTETNGEIEKAA
jgi:DNA-binding NtrC family response regulator